MPRDIKSQIDELQKYFRETNLPKPQDLFSDFKSYLFPPIESVSHLYEQKKLNIGNTKINYIVTGKGPTLVLIHGLSNNWEGWIPLLKELEPNFKVYLMDLPGYGDSDRLKYYSVKTMSYYVSQFIKQMNIVPDALIGASMGTVIVGNVIKSNPRIAKSAILIGPVIKNSRENALGYFSFKYFLQALNKAKIGEVFIRITIATRLGNYFTNKFVNMYRFDRYLSDTYGLMGKKKMSKEAYTQMGIATVAYKLEKALLSTSTRTMLIYGSKDKVSSLENARKKFLKANKDIEIAEVPDAGHIVSLEKPHEVAQAIKSYVESFESRVS